MLKWTQRWSAVCWLLEFYVLATSKVISGWIPTGDRAYSWRFYSAASLGDQTASTMSWYPIESLYPDTSHCPIIIMQRAWLGSNNYQFLSHWFYSTRGWAREFELSNLPKQEIGQLIRPSRLILRSGRVRHIQFRPSEALFWDAVLSKCWQHRAPL